MPNVAEQRDWEEIAQQDAEWAILSSSSGKYGHWDRAEFLATGEEEIAALMTRAEGYGLPRDRSAALDFGCGLGRLTRPLAGRFDRAVGVDISPRMVEGARQMHADVDGAEFVVNAAPDLSIFSDETFDLVNTRIVLQHLPGAEAIRGYVTEFIRVLRPGGLVVFQVPDALPLTIRAQPRRLVYRAGRRLGVSPKTLYWRLGLHPMRLNAVPVATVEGWLGALDARRVAVDRVRETDFGFDDATYWYTKSPG